MGVPKFFRYMSERYPCLSEVVKEYQIPQFDNLYLDMNGIIHMCSHPDDNNPHFRITEERIFKDIFHYIEVLFRMIRPQKVFFMAIDGVAPRAKMNQQRGRRFRSAKEAEKMEAEALKKGEQLPKEARFDSNCITPGTEFMARLHEQLKYFVNEKISNDTLWRKCDIILSGHETPGEGEHKIMDYIRYLRAQPDHDPNTRHCLYGLDADLIMLGLCTHEPHFSLLREQVQFGKKSTKRQSVPEEITFFLLHLSLMREYLELEFASLRDDLKGFYYDFEKIIDDWVLMGFLVGNDFIPNLPNLSINNGALPILYDVYKKVLPTLDGYINENGSLHLERFEKFMEKLSEFDFENFEEIRDDLLWMEAKSGKKSNRLAVEDMRDLETWTPEQGEDDFKFECLEPEVANKDLAMLIKQTDDLCLDSDGNESEDEDAFQLYKNDYYRTKMEYTKVTPEVLRDQADGYVRAIQWNLHYYYNGVCSWSWFYPHHYAPYISDIKGFCDSKIEFDLGEPFKPYEQLLAVLPSASKKLLPAAYQTLMTDEQSPIKKYYPEEFMTDLNGKQQEWEAVVLVPFIDENILLEAMRPINEKLTDEEKRRNCHGPMLIYKYTPTSSGIYRAPSYFPTIAECYAAVTKLNYDDIRLPIEKLVKGAYPGVKLGVFYPGFPTFKHLKYKGSLKKNKVKVFEQPSRNENMMITIIPNEQFLGDQIPVDYLGRTIHVGWPHLIEAKVVAISNAKRKYIHQGGVGEYNIEERPSPKAFESEVAGIVEHYNTRLGIQCGETNVIVFVQILTGRRYTFLPDGRMNLMRQFTHEISIYPLQAVVLDARTHDSSNSMFRDVEQVFPEGSTCFTLANPYYGSQGKILNSSETLKIGRISVSITIADEPDFSHLVNVQDYVRKSYKSLFHSASHLGLSNYVFSRITGTVLIRKKMESTCFTIGLELKQNRKNREVPGYTRRLGNVWYYTEKAVDLVRTYLNRFPEVFLFLSKDIRNDDICDQDVFPDSTEERIKELQGWLKELPSNEIERRSCGSNMLDDEITKEIEEIVDNFPTKTPKKTLTMQIKPGFIYRPEVQSGTLAPDSKVDVKLLDRIVNVREGFSVPFGLKGTVIGIQQDISQSNRDTMYNILFDAPFKDGLTISRCSEGRGYRLPIYSFINISHGKRLYEQKVGKPGVLVANAEAHRQQMQVQPPVPHPFGQFNSAFASFNGNMGRNQPTNVLPNQKHNFQQNHSTNKQNNGQRNQEQNQSYAQKMTNPPKLNTPQNSPFPKMQSSPKHNSNPNIPNSTNFFMPDFKMKPEKDVTVQNAVSTSHNEIRNVVNTEMLKNWLKIDTNKKENGETVKNNSGNVKNDNQSTSTNGNSIFQMFAKAAQAPPAAQLLTYYQSNCLGTPIYSYIDRHNSVVAQIKLPNGNIITGECGKSRDEASENVATTALRILLGHHKNPNNLPSKSLPDPPQVWMKNKDEGKKNKSHHKGANQQNGSGKSIKGVTVHNNGFIPLQVIKNRSKTDESKKVNNTTTEAEKPIEDKKPVVNNDVNRKTEQGASTSRNPKTKRKIKIAANFNVKP